MATNILVVGIIGFVLLILNVIFLGVIFFMRRKMSQVSQWPSTMGTVMMSTIEQRSSSEGGYIRACALRQVPKWAAQARGKWLGVTPRARR